MAVLGLDASNFKAGLALATTGAKQAGAAIASVFGSSHLHRFFSAAVVEEAIRRTLEYSHTIVELSKRTGLSTDEIQKFDYAATKAGIGLGQVITAFEKFQIAQAKAKGGDREAFGALTRLGLSSAQINSFKDAAEHFKLIGDRIKDTEISGQMLKDIVLVMGRSAREVLPVFKNDLRAVGDEAERLGGLMTAHQLAAGAEAAERMKLAWFQIRPLVGEVTAFLATRLMEIADFFRLSIGVMIVDLQARRDATKRSETFGGRVKENYAGQKDTIDVDKVAADARNKYIDKVLKERQEREKQIAKMEADMKKPPVLPDFAAAAHKEKTTEIDKLKDELAKKQEAHQLASLSREEQIQLLYERRLAIYNAMRQTTDEAGKLRGAIDIENIDDQIRKLGTSHTAGHGGHVGGAGLNALQRIGGMHVSRPEDNGQKLLHVVEKMYHLISEHGKPKTGWSHHGLH
jgi:hypothetical protein